MNAITDYKANIAAILEDVTADIAAAERAGDTTTARELKMDYIRIADGAKSTLETLAADYAEAQELDAPAYEDYRQDAFTGGYDYNPARVQYTTWEDSND